MGKRGAGEGKEEVPFGDGREELGFFALLLGGGEGLLTAELGGGGGWEPGGDEALGFGESEVGFGEDEIYVWGGGAGAGGGGHGWGGVVVGG